MDFVVKANELQARIAQCERDALEHEQSARALRNERAQKKAELAEINEAVSRAVAQQVAKDSAASAAASAKAAEESRKGLDADRAEVAKLIAELKAKLEAAPPAA